MGPFFSIVEDSLHHNGVSPQVFTHGMEAISKLLKFGFLSVHLTENQRAAFRNNYKSTNLNPVIISAILQRTTKFPKCSEGLFEYRSLRIGGVSYDHLVFCGFFNQPAVSIIGTLGANREVRCEYEYLEVETDSLHSGNWLLTHFDSNQIDGCRAEIEELAKGYIFRFENHSFASNPLPILERFKLLLEEAASIKAQTPTYSITTAKELGLRIAGVNSWNHNLSLSKKNGRPVFTSKHTTKYLTIDTLHPQFEVHDSTGAHIGSVPYSGGEPRNKKNHLLNVT